MPIVGVATFALIITLATILIMAAMASRYKQRELQHRERMAAVEKGVALPAEPATQPEPFHPRTYLLRGLMWLFIGIAISISFAGLAMLGEHQEPAWVRVNEATHAKERGANDAEIVQIMNDKHMDGPNPAIGLLGLIPIGVGLAYLITYRTARR